MSDATVSRFFPVEQQFSVVEPGMSGGARNLDELLTLAASAPSESETATALLREAVILVAKGEVFSVLSLHRRLFDTVLQQDKFAPFTACILLHFIDSVPLVTQWAKENNNGVSKPIIGSLRRRMYEARGDLIPNLWYWLSDTIWRRPHRTDADSHLAGYFKSFLTPETVNLLREKGELRKREMGKETSCAVTYDERELDPAKTGVEGGPSMSRVATFENGGRITILEGNKITRRDPHTGVITCQLLRGPQPDELLELEASFQPNVPLEKRFGFRAGIAAATIADSAFSWLCSASAQFG